MLLRPRGRRQGCFRLQLLEHRFLRLRRSYLRQPGVQFHCGGASGTGHGIDYFVTDPNRLCVNSAKAQLFVTDALLGNGAETAKEIIANYKPQYPSIKAYFEAINDIILDKDAVKYDENGNATVDFQNN